MSDRNPMPIGTAFMFEGVRLVTHKRTAQMVEGQIIAGEGKSCLDCWANNSKFVSCTRLPACGLAAAGTGVCFEPDLEHEPTAQRVALMRLKGEA